MRLNDKLINLISIREFKARYFQTIKKTIFFNDHALQFTMKSMIFRMPVIFVKDVSISKNFYQKIFSLEIEYDFGENVQFKDSISIWERNRAGKIIFGSKPLKSMEEIKNIELYFESSNIDAFWNKIKDQDIELIHGLKEEPWGQRTIRIFDPDKFIIEIAEPPDQVVLRLAKKGLSEKEIANKSQLPLGAVRDILKEK